MKTASWLIPVLLGAGVAAAVPPAPPALVPGDEQDLLLFTDSRPVRVRLHVQADGQPFLPDRQRYLNALFTFLDGDGDGGLSPVEAAHAPSVAQVLQMFQGVTAVEPDAAPAFAELDANPADGKVTAAELVAFYGRANVGPLQIEFGQRAGRDVLTEELFRLLDRDLDGKLSREELAASPLHRLDRNEDEVVTLSELLLGEAPATYAFKAVAAGQPPPTQPCLLLDAADPPRRFAELLMRRYDKDKNHRLSARELGRDAAAFASLDADGDGELDAVEAGQWAKRPPDVEAVVALGPGPPPRLAVWLAKDGPAAATTPVRLADTRIEVLRREDAPSAAPPQTAAVMTAANSPEPFPVADANNDGYLDGKELYRPPFEYVALLRLADRDGDKRIARAEWAAYRDILRQALTSFVLVTVADRGRSLFELLDTDRDGRLGLRELRNVSALVEAYDRDGDGCLRRDEFPHQYQLTVSRGLPRGGNRTLPEPAYGPALRAVVRPQGQGPLWFRKMDRNRDGDVSRREFLGPAAEFQRLDLDSDGLLSPAEAERGGKSQ